MLHELIIQGCKRGQNIIKKGGEAINRGSSIRIAFHNLWNVILQDRDKFWCGTQKEDGGGGEKKELGIL